MITKQKKYETINDRDLQFYIMDLSGKSCYNARIKYFFPSENIYKYEISFLTKHKLSVKDMIDLFNYLEIPMNYSYYESYKNVSNGNNIIHIIRIRTSTFIENMINREESF